MLVLSIIESMSFVASPTEVECVGCEVESVGPCDVSSVGPCDFGSIGPCDLRPPVESIGPCDLLEMRDAGDGALTLALAPHEGFDACSVELLLEVTSESNPELPGLTVTASASTNLGWVSAEVEGVDHDVAQASLVFASDDLPLDITVTRNDDDTVTVSEE